MARGSNLSSSIGRIDDPESSVIRLFAAGRRRPLNSNVKPAQPGIIACQASFEFCLPLGSTKLWPNAYSAPALPVASGASLKRSAERVPPRPRPTPLVLSETGVGCCLSNCPFCSTFPGGYAPLAPLASHSSNTL